MILYSSLSAVKNKSPKKCSLEVSILVTTEKSRLNDEVRNVCGGLEILYGLLSSNF